MSDYAHDCEVCGTRDWTRVYVGDVRDGVFGRSRANTQVFRCGGYGVERLDENACPNESFYETPAYRQRLEEELSKEAHYAVSDELQVFAERVLWPDSLRGKTIADIGCAGGSFLDHVSGRVGKAVAIEPCSVYHDSLRDRGYEVLPYAAAGVELRGQVQLATSFQVIEHVTNPRAFLADIRPLLAPNGELLLSTPNRNDILMDLLPEDFPSFFYRVVHRWYFTAETLAKCAAAAGYEVVDTRFMHRYSMANALCWLRDRKPAGHKRLSVITPLADDLWSAFLAQTGKIACLFMRLKPRP
jgi:2-polyprenyl-3-methyl-5-hydroxy-6-metoxy-1,4-benzoquinol methylase